MEDKVLTKKPRSLPIPREVNHFILNKFGIQYYLSTDGRAKIELLKQIELQLKSAGFDITWSTIERRLKNMKSHYRRKKVDLSYNITSDIVWEYYDQLDRIFSDVDLESVDDSENQDDETSQTLEKVENTASETSDPVPSSSVPVTTPINENRQTKNLVQAKQEGNVREKRPLQESSKENDPKPQDL